MGIAILGSSKWQWDVWGLFITEELNNLPHWALALMIDVMGLGMKNLLYLYFIVALINTPPMQLVMPASSLSTGIMIYKITDEAP